MKKADEAKEIRKRIRGKGSISNRWESKNHYLNDLRGHFPGLVSKGKADIDLFDKIQEEILVDENGMIFRYIHKGRRVEQIAVIKARVRVKRDVLKNVTVVYEPGIDAIVGCYPSKGIKSFWQNLEFRIIS